MLSNLSNQVQSHQRNLRGVSVPIGQRDARGHHVGVPDGLYLHRKISAQSDLIWLSYSSYKNMRVCGSAGPHPAGQDPVPDELDPGPGWPTEVTRKISAQSDLIWLSYSGLSRSRGPRVCTCTCRSGSSGSR